MVTKQRQCDEILTQIMAIKSALDRVTTDSVSWAKLTSPLG
jgi:DNA-binding FrmR family transcriptional regulator